MIRRPAGGDFLLITQTDHADLSGKLAAQIGNAQFDAPQPADAAVAAIAMHDSGWPLHDDQPTLNLQGLPLHVFETPLEITTRVWSESVVRAEACNAYAGLLVSLHVMALSEIVRRHETPPGAMPAARHHSPGDVFAINKFQINQSETQERLRNSLGMRCDLPLQFGLARPGTSQEEDRLRFNFRWLTAMDRISLQLCCGKELFACIDEIHPRIGNPALTLKLQPSSVTSAQSARPSDAPAAAPLAGMAIAPWPFAVEELDFDVPARRISGKPFVSVEEFRDAYRSAPVEAVHFRICRGA